MKPYLRAASDNLSDTAADLAGTVEVRRWVLLVLLVGLLVFAVVLAQAALWWHRREREVQVEATRVPADFNPTLYQLPILERGFVHYPASFDLDYVAAALAARGTGLVTRAQPEVVLEELCRANALERLTSGSYRLTKAGRDWAVANLKHSGYSRLEKGLSAMSVVQLQIVARLLRCTPANLLADADRYAVQLRAQGAEILTDKQNSSAAGLLIALGILAALLASKK